MLKALGGLFNMRGSYVKSAGGPFLIEGRGSYVKSEGGGVLLT